MVKSVRWTTGAQFDRKDIFSYWNSRNKSTIYSRKLYQLFKENIKLIQKHPTIGRLIKRDDIRFSIVRDYLIVYKEMQEEIIIISIWDSRQNPDRLIERIK